MIEVQELTKRYGSLTAIDRISFRVEPGEIFGLVGPDGAGKTTLMRVICDLLTPDEGNVLLYSGQLGYMPQKFSLYGDLTVMENLFFFGAMYQLSKAEIKERSDEILKITNLLPFKERLVDKLSGGMKQKLALTCSLVPGPGLLILDEPTYGIDPEFRKEFWRILYKLNEEGITILVSTPYMDEAELCTRVAFMNEGRFTAVDTPFGLRTKFPFQVWEFVSGAGLAGLFAGEEGVYDCSLYGNKYRLIFDQKIDVILWFEQKLQNINFTQVNLQRVDPSMEDVFVMLTGGEKIGRCNYIK